MPTPQSPTLPNTKYCTVCILLGKLSPTEYPITLDWEEEEDLREGKGKHRKRTGQRGI